MKTTRKTQSSCGRERPTAPVAAAGFNNILTASRLACAMSCLRKHFWAYEIGLQRTDASIALRVGSAWHRGMEARWCGLTYEEALVEALPEGIDMDAYTCETVAALLASYYDYYGPKENVATLHAEVQFKHALPNGFTAEGKIDGLGVKSDNRPVLVEAKTTGDSIDPSSEYWQRLSFNMQVYQYLIAAREHGWDVAEVIYDVCRKPSIRPKNVYDLDSKGRKIVIDAQGVRILKKDGEPRQSGDTEKGWFLKEHTETPEEYSERLWRDAIERPTFYFCRREVPIIEDQLESFKRQRDAIGMLILSLRSNESPGYVEWAPRDPEAWPRNVSEATCNFCAYKSFCLANLTVDPSRPPEGFAVKINPELETTTEETNNDTTTTDGSPQGS